MQVLRQFDSYKAGDIMTDDDIADQKRRGNLGDLIANGFVAPLPDPAQPVEAKPEPKKGRRK